MKPPLLLRPDGWRLLGGGGAQRVVRFQQLLEAHFAQEKSVAFYAATLGCTEKTLRRDASRCWESPPKR